MPISPEGARDILLAVLVGLASYTDLRFQKILNVHTFPTMGLALLLGLWSAGLAGLGVAALGWLVGGVVLLVLYMMGVMKAGDVKLAAALGALCGPGEAFRGVIMSFILYLPVGLLVLLLRRGLRNVWPAAKELARFFYNAFHPALRAEPLSQQGITLAPYGMVLGAGFLVVHFLEDRLPPPF